MPVSTCAGGAGARSIGRRRGPTVGVVEIHPRYDADPPIVIDSPIAGIRTPFLRQRRRLVSTLHELSDDEWAAPSRCEGWSSKDVIAHLASTDGFWGASLAGVLHDEPTRYLVGFDPKATPAALAEAASSVSPSDTLAGLADGVERLCDTVEALEDEDWDRTAEAPPGHVSVRTMVHHALWDAWIHERDVLEPLGRSLVEEPDEVVASLRYAAALSPAFGVQRDPSRNGTLVLEITEPVRRVVAEIGHQVTVSEQAGPGVAADAGDALVVVGRGAEVVEALSVRRPLDAPVPADKRWMVDGLAEVFETGPGRSGGVT